MLKAASSYKIKYKNFKIELEQIFYWELAMYLHCA